MENLAQRWKHFIADVDPYEGTSEFQLDAYRVEVRFNYDDSPDYSYLGEFCPFRQHPKSYLMHLDSGKIWDGSIWRDSRGKITSEPEYLKHSRQFQFCDMGTCQFERGQRHAFNYAVQNGERLRSLANESWWYLGITVLLIRDDDVTASASLWGIESDSDQSYIAEVTRDLLFESLRVVLPR